MVKDTRRRPRPDPGQGRGLRTWTWLLRVCWGYFGWIALVPDTFLPGHLPFISYEYATDFAGAGDVACGSSNQKERDMTAKLRTTGTLEINALGKGYFTTATTKAICERPYAGVVLPA